MMARGRTIVATGWATPGHIPDASSHLLVSIKRVTSAGRGVTLYGPLSLTLRTLYSWGMMTGLGCCFSTVRNPSWGRKAEGVGTSCTRACETVSALWSNPDRNIQWNAISCCLISSSCLWTSCGASRGGCCVVADWGNCAVQKPAG